ncbi:ABC transporter permease [Vagococcus intermedius]|uniref:ABC transporter permease n=1 Tax=Vagococcus intermedius TaxID=2991418 RepID=A0AAF0CV16_9ENTE|nr:ABC transporter permease [Vagococcus intermedius]WEG73445.1 ABC transporter permease [Vagococcus intermedius]WEG75528.1 ABC transporter permease [Vagococcus intermedius]
MNKFWVVALETYKRNVKSVSFVIMILAPFLMIGFSLLIGLVSAKFNDTSDIAVISNNTEIRQTYLKETHFKVKEEVQSIKAAQVAMKDKEIDGYLVIEFDDKTDKIAGDYIGSTSLGTSDELEITQALTTMQLAKISKSINLASSDLKRLNEPAKLQTKTVEFKKGKMEEKGLNRIALSAGSVFIGLAMYMIILMYAQVTATEVASEKGTRMMEIILSSTSAAKHFYGKIMGIFLVILTQVLVYFVLGVGGFMLAKDMSVIQDFLKTVSLKELLGGLLGYNLIYLLLGVVIYTILSALCGSLVSKAEDAGKSVSPVTYLTIFGFMISTMFGMSNPQHLIMKVTSYIPFFSSFTMPARIASGTVESRGIIISLLILIVSTLVLLKFSANMYRSTALMYSDENMWKVLKRSFTSMKRENIQRKKR